MAPRADGFSSGWRLSAAGCALVTDHAEGYLSQKCAELMVKERRPLYRYGVMRVRQHRQPGIGHLPSKNRFAVDVGVVML